MDSILHKIRAYLYDNQLTEYPNDFIARTSSERSLGVDEICEAASARGGADVSAAAMRHAVDLFLKEMAYQLCDGYSVNTGWFTAGTQIRGVFGSPNETFNPQKHSILFSFHQGEKLRAEIANIQVEIVGVADSGASIGQVTDVKTNSVNNLLTPGRNLRIAGHKIKVAGQNPTVGIYFVNTVTDARTKVDVSDIVTNNPSELLVVIPALAAGSYRLEVVTQYTTGELLNVPRTAVFDKVLRV